MYPLLLESAMHTRIWGGRKLHDVLGKPQPTNEPYGESWELHDTSVIVNGTLAGRTVGDVLKDMGHDLVGMHNDPAEGFPLLAKFLDAAQWLSIQVHPNDAQAAELEGEPRGKTEAWIILDAEPGAKLIIGVQPGTDREAMAEAIRENRLEALMVEAEVKAGDVLYIPAGTVHALGPGLLIYEIQQSSDLTYRLYDFGRIGLDGRPRQLHIEKGVQVSNVGALPPITHPGDDSDAAVTMVEGEYFKTVLHRVSAPVTLSTEGRTFHALTCIQGAVEVAAGDEQITLEKGRTALIPAVVGAYALRGSGEVLRSWQG
ncbi:MAG: class I mannose-6-phosphate isomerase [Anaerolineae bacterium]